MPTPLDSSFFKNNYNTSLTPQEERDYQAWADKLSEKNKRDVRNDEVEYDMRGFYKSGKAQGENAHFTDEYKKPNHPTFSDESVYHGALGPNGEKFQGGTWGDGYYAPSNEMFQYGTHSPVALQRYMQQNEPDYQVMMPSSIQPNRF